MSVRWVSPAVGDELLMPPTAASRGSGFVEGNGGVLEAVGGAGYIAELAACVPTAANASHYARIVREKALLRSLASISTEIASGAYDSPPNVDEYLDESEHKIFEISERRIRQSFYPMTELTRESLKLIERLYERKELVTGVPTG